MSQNLEAIARKIRRGILQLSHQRKTPHIGSSLSCVDILVAAYWNALQTHPHDPNHPHRDRVILSKGHAALAWYVTLCERGYFSAATLATFAQPGSKLGEHPSASGVPGVELATGSLGHGLPVANGLALGARIMGQSTKVMVVLSDGECNEGAVWEAALFASAQRLDRLIAIIDFNKWQATGRSQDVLSLDPLTDKWRAFGWNVQEVDGHSLSALSAAMSQLHPTQPTAIIAHTIKGQGVSYMEDDNNWHYAIPNDQQLQQALAELA